MGRERRIFVGDIQGCSAELDRLLRELKMGSGDQLYCVGDLVNRGHDSLGVLRRLRESGAHTVLGNHDLYLLKIAAGRIRVAADHRVRAVLDAPDAAELVHWLEEQPILHVEDDVAVVHGGLHPSWSDLVSLQSELNAAVMAHVGGAPDWRIEFATSVRYCDASGQLPPADYPPPAPPFFPWDHFYAGERIIVFGHWARRGVVHGAHVRGLDSGCVYGGPLTAWIAEEDRFVQVKA